MSNTLIDFVVSHAPPHLWDTTLPSPPWHDEAFSQRNLHRVLATVKDEVSPFVQQISQQVAWLHTRVLRQSAGHVLELGSGAGFYATRLALHGHAVLGIDISPALVRYAQQVASKQGLTATYVCGDVRALPFESGYTLVMLRRGFFNRFRRVEAANILSRAYEALSAGGWLLLEVRKLSKIRQYQATAFTWQALNSGLFLDEPHLHLQAYHWYASAKTGAHQHHIVHAATGMVTTFTSFIQGYAEWELSQLMSQHGFTQVQINTSPDEEGEPWVFVTARKL